MYRIQLCLFIIALHTWNARATFRYDYKYSRHANGWLKLHEVPTTFNEAFLRCDFEGAVLASPSDYGLQKALKLIFPNGGRSSGLYTGIHATIFRGEYTTIEGIPLSRIPVEWGAGEPKDYSEDEGCLVMLSDGTLAGASCNESHPFACFKKKDQKVVMNECGTVDNAYKLDARTGSCYKFHRTGMSWRRAYSVCLAEGGHLAIINSQLESQVIKEVFEKSDLEAQTVKDMLPQVSPNIAFIGFLDWGSKGMWYTIHGQTLQNAGFYTWAKDQPDNSTAHNSHGERCGSVVNTGVLNDVPCENLDLRFICEKDPASLELDEYDFVANVV